MDAAVRAAVRERAGDGCEYCHRRQSDSPFIPLQIEHVIARKHGGDDELQNLACVGDDASPVGLRVPLLCSLLQIKQLTVISGNRGWEPPMFIS
ncbi:MAG: HNH endonuclease [Planctomycetes bacterium]|nr:HNH endonuclease [Planctomycetota bacterium]